MQIKYLIEHHSFQIISSWFAKFALSLHAISRYVLLFALSTFFSADGGTAMERALENAVSSTGGFAPSLKQRWPSDPQSDAFAKVDKLVIHRYLQVHNAIHRSTHTLHVDSILHKVALLVFLKCCGVDAVQGRGLRLARCACLQACLLLHVFSVSALLASTDSCFAQGSCLFRPLGLGGLSALHACVFALHVFSVSALLVSTGFCFHRAVVCTRWLCFFRFLPFLLYDGHGDRIGQ